MSRGTRKDKHHRDRDDSRYGSNTNLAPGSPNISAAMSKEHSQGFNPSINESGLFVENLSLQRPSSNDGKKVEFV